MFGGGAYAELPFAAAAGAPAGGSSSGSVRVLLVNAGYRWRRPKDDHHTDEVPSGAPPPVALDEGAWESGWTVVRWPPFRRHTDAPTDDWVPPSVGLDEGEPGPVVWQWRTWPVRAPAPLDDDLPTFVPPSIAEDDGSGGAFRPWALRWVRQDPADSDEWVPAPAVVPLDEGEGHDVAPMRLWSRLRWRDLPREADEDFVGTAPPPPDVVVDAGGSSRRRSATNKNRGRETRPLTKREREVLARLILGWPLTDPVPSAPAVGSEPPPAPALAPLAVGPAPATLAVVEDSPEVRSALAELLDEMAVRLPARKRSISRQAHLAREAARQAVIRTAEMEARAAIRAVLAQIEADRIAKAAADDAEMYEMLTLLHEVDEV